MASRRIIEGGGYPRIIASDNGTEFTSKAILAWQEERGVERHYIAPSKPMYTAFAECVDGNHRGECLSETMFVNVTEVNDIFEIGRIDYSNDWPPQRAQTN